MSKLTPFADDVASVSIGGMTIENGTERVAIYGSLDITRDKAGLAHARALKEILDRALRAREGDPQLPEQIAPPDKPNAVRNPFA